jgi:polyisoprenoid-binding protein YceI
MIETSTSFLEESAMTITTNRPAIAAGTWKIDTTHSEIGFTVRHLMSKVRGTFREFGGAIEVAPDLAESRVAVTVRMDSIDTGTRQRDDHVRSGDFLDIAAFPTMTFVSRSLRPDGEGFLVSGDLTVKGVTRPVELAAEFLGVEDLSGDTRIGFEARTTINRKDFGVDANVPLGGERFLIGDEVRVELAVEAVLQPETAQ